MPVRPRRGRVPRYPLGLREWIDLSIGPPESASAAYMERLHLIYAEHDRAFLVDSWAVQYYRHGRDLRQEDRESFAGLEQLEQRDDLAPGELDAAIGLPGS